MGPNCHVLSVTSNRTHKHIRTANGKWRERKNVRCSCSHFTWRWSGGEMAWHKNKTMKYDIWTLQKQKLLGNSVPKMWHFNYLWMEFNNFDSISCYITLGTRLPGPNRISVAVASRTDNRSQQNRSADRNGPNISMALQTISIRWWFRQNTQHSSEKAFHTFRVIITYSSKFIGN